MPRKSPIRITKPDPETGEVCERKVPASHFSPPLPRYPVLDEDRAGIWRRGGELLRTGPAVLYLLTHAEQVIEFWLAHPNFLTRAERLEILDDATVVIRPSEFKPTWEAGDELEVAHNLTAVVRDVTHTIKGHRTRLLVRDFRAVFVKRSPGSSSPPKVDKYGDPVPATPEEIAAARIEGNYTSSQALAVPDTGEEIEGNLHRRLHQEQSMANAMAQTKKRVKLDALRLEARLAEARRKNWRGTVRYLERVKRHREDRDAA